MQEDRIAEVEKKLHESYFTEPMTIRPYQDTSKLYLNAKTFRKLFRGKQPDFVGATGSDAGPTAMKFFSAGLTFVNVATIAGLLLGILGGGLDGGFAGLALFLGLAAAIYAWFGTAPVCAAERKWLPPPPTAPLPKSKRARRRMKLETPPVVAVRAATAPPGHFWAWAVGIVFAHVRGPLLLLAPLGRRQRISRSNRLTISAISRSTSLTSSISPTASRSGPITRSTFSALRYPAGIDFFNSLLLLQHIDLVRALVWTGLLGSVATFYGFYRWGGAFGIAGFLFNGGLAGYAFFQSRQVHRLPGRADRLEEHSADHVRHPARVALRHPGRVLLLLLHWRRKYYPSAPNDTPGARRGFLPWWVEWSLYATLPLFHVHTFLALSIVLGFWLVIGTWEMRKQVALLLAAAFLPATAIVWMITDHFQAKSILAWAPGWLQSDPGFSNSAVSFWLINFGLTLPAMIALAGVVVWQAWKKWQSRTESAQGLKADADRGRGISRSSE